MKNSVSVTADEYFKYFTPDPEAYDTHTQAVDLLEQNLREEYHDEIEVLEGDVEDLQETVKSYSKLTYEIEKLTNVKDVRKLINLFRLKNYEDSL